MFPFKSLIGFFDAEIMHKNINTNTNMQFETLYFEIIQIWHKHALLKYKVLKILKILKVSKIYIEISRYKNSNAKA